MEDVVSKIMTLWANEITTAVSESASLNAIAG